VGTIQALLDQHLDGTAAVGLVGPGDVGKTRLAVAAAAALADAYPDGVVFVDLGPVRQPRLVATTILHALRLRGADGAGAAVRAPA
jgi:predicted ATPase